MRLIPDNINFEDYITTEEKANVKSALFYADQVIDKLYGQKEREFSGTLPWHKTYELFRFRPGEVTLWPGYNGHGKSMVVGQIILHLLENGDRACIASFEMKPVTTLTRMCRQAVGVSEPSIEYIRRFHTWVDERLWLYDQQGTVKSERVIGVIYYAVKELRINHFVIDSLMKCGINEDDYNSQKRFIDQLCAVAKDTGCHIHLICHSRKGADEYTAPGKMDVKGTGSITDQVDNVMTVWRNKKKEQLIEQGKATQETLDKPDMLLICDKQRNFEWEGSIRLWFDKPSYQYLASPDHRARGMELKIANYVPGSED